MDTIGLLHTLGTMERGSPNGKTSRGAPSHSRTPGQVPSGRSTCPGWGRGSSMHLRLTIMKVVIAVSCIQGRVMRASIQP